MRLSTHCQCCADVGPFDAAVTESSGTAAHQSILMPRFSWHAGLYLEVATLAAAHKIVLDHGAALVL